MLLPPVARIVATPGWFMSAPVASSDGSVIQLMQSVGAPAAIAASRTIRADSAEHFCAAGWKANTMGLRVLSASSALKIVVEVGLVTGVMPATTPTGSAISTSPRSSSRAITPTVLSPRRLLVTCSQAKMFFTALSSTRPRPVYSAAS
jgi:hypothetical protein